MKLEELNEESGLNKEKIEDCISKLEKVLTENNLTVGEILLTYGNLGYKLGASIRKGIYDSRFVSEPPNTEELGKLYYSNPTPDVALMITGLTVTSWVDSLLKQQEQDDLK